MRHQSKTLEEKFLCIQDYFRDGTAETERNDILQKVFVETEVFSNILNIGRGCPQILVGKKGTGKSAILNYLAENFEREKVSCLLLTPRKIDIDWGDDNSTGQLTRRAMRSLTMSIAAQLGRTFSEKFLNGNNTILNEIAKKYTDKEQDTVEVLCEKLNAVSKEIANIDFGSLFKHNDVNEIATPKIITSIKNNLRNANKVFYLFIDNTDQLASPNLESGLNRIWATLLAFRELMNEIPFLKVIVSLRTTVWYRLGNDESGQRDQWDHFRPHVTEIKVSDEEIEKMVEKRLKLAAKSYSGSEDYLKFFFNNKRGVAVNEKTFRYWSNYVAHRSRNRPRDAMQMVGRWGKYCITKESDYITSEIVNQCMITHSEFCVDDLVREYKEECPKLETVIKNFSKLKYDAGKYAYSADSLREQLPRILNGIMLNGKALSPQIADAIKLWKFLYEIGFLSARYETSQRKDNYEHITFQQAPSLLGTSDWNTFQKYTWEVYPSYIDFLEKEYNEDIARLGIGIKPVRYVSKRRGKN